MDPQPDKHTHDDADLHSFIQSGMGIALPALEMDIPHDHDAAEGGEGAFEEGDFRELMREKQEGEGKRMREGTPGGDDPRKRARDASPVPTHEDHATPTHQEPLTPTPAPPPDPAPSSRPETAEERKARQREANRLAAGRSRGKKRDEL